MSTVIRSAKSASAKKKAGKAPASAKTAPAAKTRTIAVDYLPRVEGEGAIHIRMKGDAVQEVKVKIFEPPRLFEAFLEGRHYDEVPDITARICGICPIAYQMSSVHAIERAYGVEIDPAVRLLRRLIYCGEWIESHVLHVFMLHAPDFFGANDVIELAAKHEDLVKRALELKKIGNEIVSILGGREIHPISVRVGGFSRTPRPRELRGLAENLKWALDAAIDLAKFTATLDFPDFESNYEFVALSHPDEYPFSEGRVVSSKGVDVDASEFEDHFREHHVAHSNALQCSHVGSGSYHVGPLARFALNFEKLSPLAKQVARDCGLPVPCRNPFKSIVVRMVETVFACEEALRVIGVYEPPESPCARVKPRNSTGWAVTEAPRGILYHRYQVGADGLVKAARIVPPTSQNQSRMEEDLREMIPGIASLSDADLTRRCEQAVRNYDPCISCATHFLKATLVRE
ncbi:MAG: Ni/Fe hydrogenase subunit alpha [Bryobacterales bacterium]|nr:Ni/Fe hydrogenase subunit alpha [Bryobacterales bacterium]